MSLAGPVLFRYDAYPELGGGHLQRCRALATELEGRGIACHHLGRVEGFAIPDTERRLAFDAGRDDARQVVEHAGRIDAGTLVLDLPGLDEAYQRTLHEAGLDWLHFEGRPSRRLWGRWLLAASPAASPERYTPWLQRADARLLLGPAYAILRQSIVRALADTRPGDRVERVVVTLGGGDDRGGIELCLEALAAWRTTLQVDVLTTSANPSLPGVQAWIARHGGGWCELGLDAEDFPMRLARADLALIGGGTTGFETAYLGVPALILRIADDQTEQAAAWDRLGVARLAGDLASLDVAGLRAHLHELIDDSGLRRQMSARGRERVDGLGARRVADALLKG